MTTLALDQNRCVQCGLCAGVCPIHVIRRHGDREIAIIERLLPHCIQCGHCVAVCPRGALTLNGISPDTLQPVKAAPLDSIQRDMLFKTRRSVRHFKDTPIPLELLQEALEDARYAPTGGNNQAVEWLLVLGKEKIRTVGARIVDWIMETDSPYRMIAAAFKAGSDPIFRNAPALILAHSEQAIPVGIQDASAAVTYLELSLHSRGIGTCWAGFPVTAAQAGVDLGLPIPPGRQIYAGLMLGFPQTRFARVPPRRPVRLTVI